MAESMGVLPASKKRDCLESLKAERLRELVELFGVEPASRRKKSDLVAALADGRRVDFGEVLHRLKLAELRRICGVLALDARGTSKDELVQRIMGNGLSPEGGAVTPEEAEPLTDSTAPPPMSARSSGRLKSALRRFVLDTAGGYRGRDAGVQFTTRLLECFGWQDGRPPDAEIPAAVTVVEGGQKATREVACLWDRRRVLIYVTKHDVMLDFAWNDVHKLCLQLEPVPQYVVLTNQRDLHLYDLARSREEPRLPISVDDLPKYSEAFPFLAQNWVPGTTPRIINVAKVSKEVADLVARLYRSLRDKHPDREADVISFTLQCIITMFAEDIGLLPQEYFTTLLYEGARHGDVGKRIAEMFRLMSTRDTSAPRVVPYFNGGLFCDPVTLELGDAQLAALTKAAEADWKDVDPHIFGSVFQGVMSAEERHATGGHYTAQEDIMRVVGPTIVEPWRERIQAARTLKELLDVRRDLMSFRVLDPACGSGNFLYIAFRELYKLDTELLARIREYPSTQALTKARIRWGVGIETSNFYGIDINPFAVELAKLTLNIAKKIAYDERRQAALELVGQVEMDVDPTLPLDNLDQNIVCADALFSEWPKVDSIVGNPPFLGGTKIRAELGDEYLATLQEAFPTVPGRADYCSYWFRRAHDRLGAGGRAGLVATNTIREGNTLDASTGYIVANGGTITNAVSSRPWPGDAVVRVSMVNWVKGVVSGPYVLIVDDTVYERERIPPHLRLHVDLSSVRNLQANSKGSTKGVDLGTKACQFPRSKAVELWEDPAARPFLKPLAHGKHLMPGRLSVDPEYTVDMSACVDLEAAKEGGAAFELMRLEKLPSVKAKAASYAGWLDKWWQPWRARESFFRDVAGCKRILICVRHAKRPVFVFLSSLFLPTDSLQLFAFDDDYSFGVLQSSLHWRWAVAQGSKIKEDTRYTMQVWETFPWPQGVGEHEIVAVAAAARKLRAVRDTLMRANDWSLRALHQAAELAGSHPLNDAQRELDSVVAAAYGMPSDLDVMEFLLDLNLCLSEDEHHGRSVTGPGLPKDFDSKDPRWFSEDCIEPPPLDT